MSNSSSTGHAAETWAEIRAHDRVTRYRRHGSGPPVLLLYASDDGALWPALLEALGDRFRVIVPEIAEAQSDVTCRLAEFLEGLGCARAAVIGNARLGAVALEVAATGTDQIARVVIIAGSAKEAQPVMPSEIPTLRLAADGEVSRILDIVREFLARR
jgi:pimeloyl-ACP methyl ester carboxylesterase